MTDMASFLGKVTHADAVIGQALAAYRGRIAVGCSFGKDSLVLLHLVRQQWAGVPVVTILADTEFPETEPFIRAVADEWSLLLTIHRFRQATGVECCTRPKVEATRFALQYYEAWFAGLRASEAPTRADVQEVETRGLVKVNPILAFTELDVWRYTAVHRLPVHPLYAQGYRSLGCARCSIPERDEAEPERAGRWPGSVRTECGIHEESMRPQEAQDGQTAPREAQRDGHDPSPGAEAHQL